MIQCCRARGGGGPGKKEVEEEVLRWSRKSRREEAFTEGQDLKFLYRDPQAVNQNIRHQLKVAQWVSQQANRIPITVMQ